MASKTPAPSGALAPPPTLVLDTGVFAERKLAALTCHRTQVTGSAFALVEAGDAARLLGVEHYRGAPVGARGDTFLEPLVSPAIAARRARCSQLPVRAELIDILRCPYCGTRLSLEENEALVRAGDRIESGVLGCECCAFPIVAGIPVLIADDATRGAMHALEAGGWEDALFSLVGVEGTRAAAFRALLARGEQATYREALTILSRDAEGTCFHYPFSDPTYLVAETLLQALAQQPWTTAGRCVDLCGGASHLTGVSTWGVEYVVGMAENAVLARHAGPVMTGVRAEVVATDATAHVYGADAVRRQIVERASARHHQGRGRAPRRTGPA